MTSEERLYYLRNQYVDGLLTPDEERELRAAIPNVDTDEEILNLRALKAQTNALPLERQPGRDLWMSIESGLRTVPLTREPASRLPSWAVTGISWAGIAAAAVVAFILLRPAGEETPPATGWSITSSEGNVYLGEQQAAKHAALRKGVLLSTGNGATATLSGVNIGTLTLEGNSELALLRADTGQHRLKLTKGIMHAVVTTPPRFFAVETPSVTAVDLGCAYTIETDSLGNGRLEVTAGYVALEKKAHTALVPRGYACRMYGRTGPGTPYSTGATDDFVTALNRYDEQGERSAVYTAVEHARFEDALSLWHLLWEATGKEKAYLCSSLALFVSMPAGVDRAAVLANDKQAYLLWGQELGVEPWMIDPNEIPTPVHLRLSKKM